MAVFIDNQGQCITAPVSRAIAPTPDEKIQHRRRAIINYINTIPLTTI